MSRKLKTAVAICEYNPLHNGHMIHLAAMRNEFDTVAVITSGNFCQRGELSVCDKYARARHAVLSGADIVFELPTVFAVSPAEIFAKGGIKLLDSLPGEKTLFFGTEYGDSEAFLTTARAMLDESKEFKDALKAQLSTGAPFALARENALKATSVDVDEKLLQNPNSVLGLEYAKAIISSGSKMKLHPIERVGGYNDLSLDGEVCSAAAIRNAIADGKRKKIKSFVPNYVYGDLPDKLPSADEILIYRILEAQSKDLRAVTDCTEGLENRIKAFAKNTFTVKELIDKLETRRYTRARLARIITSNALGITREFTEKCLKSNLYLKVLAVAAERTDLLSEFSGGKNKLLTRKLDCDSLTGTAKLCFLKDAFANDVYNLASGKKTNEFEMKIVKR